MTNNNPQPTFPIDLPSSISAILSPSEERTWSMLAHLSILINLFTGFLGPVIALIIYLVYRNQSRYVAYQSLQSFILQIIVWIGGGLIIGIIWVITGILSIYLIGIYLIPVSIIITGIVGFLPIIAVIYGIAGVIQCHKGRDFRYWLIGDWVRNSYTATPAQEKTM